MSIKKGTGYSSGENKRGIYDSIDSMADGAKAGRQIKANPTRAIALLN